MSILNNSLLLGADAGAVEYQIQRSLRFNSSDSAYLSRTPASAGNRKTWTWSGWVKRSRLSGSDDALFIASGGSGLANAGIDLSSDQIRVVDYNGSSIVWRVQTSAVLRDASAWYHIVVSVDTTQSTASDRVKIWINGILQTAFANASYPSQNVDSYVNNTQVHYIGANISVSTASLYLADIHFIDGQALTPSSFAETNITTGQWVPKAYTGTYGTNGFRLAFADNSNNTATTLGKDSSPNGNNWTPNNLSVTAGVGNDSLVDTPTSYGTDTGAGGEVRGNYATLNPLSKGSQITLSNGNLDYSHNGTTVSCQARASIAITSGKWYCEHTTNSGGTFALVGIVSAAEAPNSGYVGQSSTSYGYYASNGRKYNNSVEINYGATYTNGDVVGIAFDADNGTLTFYKNGISQGTAFSSIPAGTYLFAQGNYPEVTYTGSFNFGQRPFAYTAPSGFKALCDTNLPAPVVAKPNSVFDVKLYTGTGSSQTISGLAFSPDLVWTKSRNNTFEHTLSDTVRGANKQLYSSLTNAETSNTDAITAFNSDGFTVGANGGTGFSSTTYVGWAWDAGSSTVTNTQGSITSQVRANASAGFSIVTYSQGATNGTIGHGLGIAPAFIIVKSRTVSGTNWPCYHISLGKDLPLQLSTTSAQISASNYWGTTAPSATTFGVGTAGSQDNNNGDMVAYCFAPVAGYSSFGSYTGNGSADGPFVYTGFRPRWLLIKVSSTTGDWILFDSARATYNGVGPYLFPNTAGAENSTGVANDLLDMYSNGFKLRGNYANTNQSSSTYVYAAFAENPFQYARAR